jgi:hypothetical protein
MKRPLKLAVAAVTIATLTTTYAVGPAAATNPTPVTPGASAYAAAAGTGSATLKANLQLTGAIGHLLDGVIDPIVQVALDPLLAALTGTVNTLVAGALGASSTLNAGTPSQQYGTAPAAFPTDTLPSPCSASGPQPCFSVTSGGVNASPLAVVGLSLINGYTQQVPVAADATNSIFGRAQVASPTVSVLPLISALTNPLVSAGVVNAKANCPNDGAVGATKPKTSPSALVSAAGVTLLGGLVTLDVLNGQVANLKVAGTSYTLPTLPVLNVGGVTVSPYGTALMVTISLSPAQILGALGLGTTIVTQLLGFAPTSTLALRLIVGPNSTATTTSATAWGLGIGVDLSGSLSFNLLGLVGAAVTVPSGITGSNYGDLVDLRLATTNCQSGTNTPALVPIVPPALV